MIKIILLLLISCVGCRSVKPIVLERVRLDSIVVVEQIRDTIVTLERDSSMIRALVECDSVGEAHLKEIVELRRGERVKIPSLSLKSNKLTVVSVVDSVDIYLKLKDRYTTKIESEVRVERVEVNILTGWQKFWMRAGQILSVISIVIALIKFNVF